MGTPVKQLAVFVAALGLMVNACSASVKNMYSYVIEFGDPARRGVLDRFVSPDATFAASTWDWMGTNTLGQPFDLSIAPIHEYQDGKIVKETAYYASPDAYGQLMGSQ